MDLGHITIIAFFILYIMWANDQFKKSLVILEEICEERGDALIKMAIIEKVMKDKHSIEIDTEHLDKCLQDVKAQR